MRLTKAAAAALAATLSGSLALGVAGTADAGERHTVAASVRAAAPWEAETTQQQFLVIERLGQLTVLTGTLGRLTHDEHANPLLLRSVQHRLHKQLQLVKAALDKARPVNTLPRNDRKNEPAVSFDDAAAAFRTSVDGILAVRRNDTKARTEASSALVRNLSTVNVAAMTEAGMPIQQTLPHTLPQPTDAAKGTKPANAPKDMNTAKAAVTSTRSGPSSRLHKASTLDGADKAVKGIEAVGDLVDAVLEAPGGRLSRAAARQHTMEINKAVGPLRHRTAWTSTTVSRTRARSSATEAAELQDRADALLTASAARAEARQTRAEAGRLTRSAAGYLAALIIEGGR